MSERSKKLVQRMEAQTGEPLAEIEDFSAGCIVFSTYPESSVDSRIESVRVLLVGMGKGSDLWWAFPKGHPDEGESLLSGALREVREETGVVLEPSKVSEEFQELRYTLVGKMHIDRWRRHPDFGDESKRPVIISFKTVRLYGAYSELSELAPAEHEVNICEWVPLRVAYERLAYSPESIQFIQFFLKNAFICECLGIDSA